MLVNSVVTVDPAWWAYATIQTIRCDLGGLSVTVRKVGRKFELEQTLLRLVLVLIGTAYLR